MENLATHWVLTFGRDCDGFNSGRIYKFCNEQDACDFAQDLNDGSDGLQYRVTQSFNELKEYSSDYDLDINDYL
jgi:hypothetical protein